MLRVAIASVALIVGGGFAPTQDRQQCAYAIDAYNAAIDDQARNVRRYGDCLAGSRGNDDCSSEFRRIRIGQSDFETAISGYRSYCQ